MTENASLKTHNSELMKDLGDIQELIGGFKDSSENLEKAQLKIVELEKANLKLEKDLTEKEKMLERYKAVGIG